MSLMSFAKHSLFALHPLLAFAGVAMASDMLTLRAEAVVSADVVRLGDLVTGAGARGHIALFKAPEIGRAGTIRAETIAAAAAELGLAGLELRGIATVTVTRATPPEMGLDELAGHIKMQLVAIDASLSDATISLDGVLPAFRTGKPLADALALVSFDVESGRFRANVTDMAGRIIPIAGLAQSMVAVPVLIRSVGRGDVISPADIVMEQRGRRSLPAGLVTDPARLASMVAKRALKPGPIRSDDVTGRDLVERNQKVTVSLAQSGMVLTLAGKALAAGAQGSIVQVQNLASKRTFDAVVTGPGAVSAKLQ